jgi:hypothetical protein
VLAKGNDFVPIPDTKRRRFLEENLAVAEIALSPRIITMNWGMPPLPS